MHYDSMLVLVIEENFICSQRPESLVVTRLNREFRASSVFLLAIH